MRKLILFVTCIISLILGVSCNSVKIPMCGICNKIEIYIEKMPWQMNYLILNYVDSVFYFQGKGFPVSFGKFSIHNDTLTCEQKYDLMYKNLPQSFKAALSEDEYPEEHINHFRIERGGESLYSIKLIHYPGTPNTQLEIRKLYKCHGSFKNLPIEELYKNADFLKDSLEKDYERKKNAGSLNGVSL